MDYQKEFDIIAELNNANTMDAIYNALGENILLAAENYTDAALDHTRTSDAEFKSMIDLCPTMPIASALLAACERYCSRILAENREAELEQARRWSFDKNWKELAPFAYIHESRLRRAAENMGGDIAITRNKKHQLESVQVIYKGYRVKTFKTMKACADWFLQ